MKRKEAYEILDHHKNWHLIDRGADIKQALNIALNLLEKHRCGYCDIIMDEKGSKYGDYGRVCDNCYENLS